METLTINFPSMTAEEIIKESGNKVSDGKLLWNVDWYKDEDFYTKDKTRAGERVIELELQDKNVSGRDCLKKDSKQLLNFAEIVYMAWKYEKKLKGLLNGDYTWTSSFSSGGRLVNFGNFGAYGASVSGRRPDCEWAYLGAVFSRSESLLESRVTVIENKLKALADLLNNSK